MEDRLSSEREVERDLCECETAAGLEPGAPRGKSSSSAASPGLRQGVPGLKGDNCLLTRGSTFVDFAFSRLLALRCSVVARQVSAVNRGERLGQTPGGGLSLYAHGL